MVRLLERLERRSQPFLVLAGLAVLAVIGIIEGIIYLTKSDEEFVRTYVDSQKHWF